MRLLFIALLFYVQLGAYTLDEIISKPESRAKNFLIWEYLQNDALSTEEADKAFYASRVADRRLFMAYAKHTNDESVRYTAECWDGDPKALIKQGAGDCLMLALSPYKATKLSNEERLAAAKILQGSDSERWLTMMADPKLLEHLDRYDPADIVYLFNSAGTAFRQQHFNVAIAPETLKTLSKARAFSRFVHLAVLDEKMTNLQRALLALDAAPINADAQFYMAMNKLRFDDKAGALYHLEKAHDSAYYRMDKDKALFWQYLVSKESRFLTQLNESFDINVYTLYAAELTDKNIDNYYTTLKHADGEPPIDIRDPFAWKALLDTVKETPKDALADLAENYRYAETFAVQSFILERYHGYKMHGFIMPYPQALASLDNDRKALTYALMRQESHFIPSALSYSYALGLMQLMPFLVKHLDKQFKQPRKNLSEMFDPNRNIAYAIKHLDYLQKYLYHPLFVAYAYNGGIGFTKRMLKNGTFKKGKYEPFWSMEMMINSESREYGKKVLANYVIYKKILGEKTSILRLFDMLTQPSRTDRFRE